MCKNELNLTVLPDVLQDLVLMYTYNLPKKQVVASLKVILGIIDMQLPFFLIKDRIWSWHYETFLPNPIRTFMPIEYYDGRYENLFEEDSMYCLLLGLDFRRRNVRRFGDRKRWFHRIVTNWRSVEPFSAYYKMLLRTKCRITKKRGPLVRRFI